LFFAEHDGVDARDIERVAVGKRRIDAQLLGERAEGRARR
jgi:hypothetical protein